MSNTWKYNFLLIVTIAVSMATSINDFQKNCDIRFNPRCSVCCHRAYRACRNHCSYIIPKNCDCTISDSNKIFMSFFQSKKCNKTCNIKHKSNDMPYIGKIAIEDKLGWDENDARNKEMVFDY